MPEKFLKKPCSRMFMVELFEITKEEKLEIKNKTKYLLQGVWVSKM